MPFANDFFDIIIAKHVLQLVPNTATAMNEVYRYLKKNGISIGVLCSVNTQPKLRQFLEQAGKELHSTHIQDDHKRLSFEQLPPFSLVISWY